jgi:putative serine protease PepD
MILVCCLGSWGCDADRQQRGGPSGTSNADTAPATHGYLGIILVDPAAAPLVVQGFVPDSPAETSGLQPGDILLRIDRQRRPTHEQLRSVVEQLSPGDSVGVRVARGDEELEYRVSLVSYDFIEQAMPGQSDSGG